MKDCCHETVVSLSFWTAGRAAKMRIKMPAVRIAQGELLITEDKLF